MALSLSKTDICNGALSLIGQSPITDLDTDTSEEADQCRIWYERTRNKLLEFHPWRFAEHAVALTADVTAINPLYAYSYQLPDDFVRFTSSDIEYLPWRREGNKLVTDESTVTLTYIRDLDNVGLYPAIFITALEFALAAMLCYALTKDRLLTRELKAEAKDMAEEMASTDSQGIRNETWLIDELITVRNERG